MSAQTIDDLTAELSDALGLDRDAVRDAIRVHRRAFGRYEDVLPGTPERLSLSRAVWATVTEGAEWPFGAEG